MPFHRGNIKHVPQIQESTHVPELDKVVEVAKLWRLPGFGKRDALFRGATLS